MMYMEELKVLREKVKYLINMPSYARGGNSQRHIK